MSNRHIRGARHQSPKDVETLTVMDGSMIVSQDQLKRYGDGDVFRGRRELRALLAPERDAVIRGPTEKPKGIRIAGPADEQRVLDLLLMDLAENAEHIAPISEERVIEHIQAGTRQRGGVVAVVDGPNDVGPVAVTIIHPAQWWWSNGYYWFEVVNFVHPDYRRHGIADELLDFGKWWTDHTTEGSGYQNYFLCGVLGAWRVMVKVLLYRRKFRQCGAAFIYPAPPSKGN